MVNIFLENDNINVKVPNTKSLRYVATKTGASMEFGCRVGDCLTCVARVKSGMEFLNKKNDKEIKALEILAMNVEGLRLMCQCNVEADEGEIVISYGF